MDLGARDFIEIDPKYFRPAEVDQLLGDATRARERLGWVPCTTVQELAKVMVKPDWEEARRERVLCDRGL